MPPQDPPKNYKGTASPPYLPGFGLPLNYAPVDDNRELALFYNALIVEDVLHKESLFLSNANWRKHLLPLTTLREFTMLRLMNQLTDKPDWDKKVFHEVIIEKWKAEALSAKDLDVTPAMFDWCIAELQYKTKHFQSSGGLVTVYDGFIVKSDVTIPPALQEALKTAVTLLENVPEREKDWHPGSGERVLDLVHPSLFPLVYGRSRILKEGITSLDDCIERSGEGEVIPIPPAYQTKGWWSPKDDQLVYEKEQRERKEYHQRVQRAVAGRELDDDRLEPNFEWWRNPYSRKFQWLPCEVDISGEDDSVKITSYINNLHPQHHKNLYGVIEKIIARAISLWNLTLTPLRSPETIVQRIQYKEVKYELDPEKADRSEVPEQEADEDYHDFYCRRECWIKRMRRAVQPEPGVFCEPPFATPTSQYYLDGTDELDPQFTVDLHRDYGESGLQIIVKLANIHLTPEKPKYEGGTWHVEGQLNEHICSTALYYYDNENITASTLAFRRQSDPNVKIAYEQDTDDWLQTIFGCSGDGPAVQDIGPIDTREGRLITFPNIFQHQVQPFKLMDPTKPGHRKILALFLVDPHIRTISTAHVPCQQKEWWVEAVRTNEPLNQLPVEVQELVVDAVDGFPISLQEAKQLREELMAERKVFLKDHSREFSSLNFSLCEH